MVPPCSQPVDSMCLNSPLWSLGGQRGKSSSSTILDSDLTQGGKMTQGSFASRSLGHLAGRWKWGAVGKQEITDGKAQHACPWEEVFKCLIWRMPSVPSPASGVLTRLLSQSCEDDLGPGSNEIPGASFAAFLNLIRSRASSTDYLCPTPDLLCFSGFQIQSCHTAKSDRQTDKQCHGLPQPLVGTVLLCLDEISS